MEHSIWAAVLGAGDRYRFVVAICGYRYRGRHRLALIISPQTVTSLLLGADLAVAGIAVGRVAGIALP